MKEIMVTKLANILGATQFRLVLLWYPNAYVLSVSDAVAVIWLGVERALFTIVIEETAKRDGGRNSNGKHQNINDKNKYSFMWNTDQYLKSHAIFSFIFYRAIDAKQSETNNTTRLEYKNDIHLNNIHIWLAVLPDSQFAITYLMKWNNFDRTFNAPRCLICILYQSLALDYRLWIERLQLVSHRIITILQLNINHRENKMNQPKPGKPSPINGLCCTVLCDTNHLIYLFSI